MSLPLTVLSALAAKKESAKSKCQIDESLYEEDHRHTGMSVAYLLILARSGKCVGRSCYSLGVRVLSRLVPQYGGFTR